MALPLLLPLPSDPNSGFDVVATMVGILVVVEATTEGQRLCERSNEVLRDHAMVATRLDISSDRTAITCENNRVCFLQTGKIFCRKLLKFASLFCHK